VSSTNTTKLDSSERLASQAAKLHGANGQLHALPFVKKARRRASPRHVIFHPWMEDETIFCPWMQDEGFCAKKTRPIEKVEKRLASGRCFCLSRLAKIWNFHVHESGLPPQGLFQPVHTVLLSSSAPTTPA
jgi:hypothetical protein